MGRWNTEVSRQNTTKKQRSEEGPTTVSGVKEEQIIKWLHINALFRHIKNRITCKPVLLFDYVHSKGNHKAGV